MRKKRNTISSGLQGVLPAALVLLGWVTFVLGQTLTGLPVVTKLILLVVARVLPQMLLCILLTLQPNQSLKLTEVAVDDFAARQFAENEMISRYVRAMNYMEQAVRRRSLAPVR